MGKVSHRRRLYRQAQARLHPLVTKSICLTESAFVLRHCTAMIRTTLCGCLVKLVVGAMTSFGGRRVLTHRVNSLALTTSALEQGICHVKGL